MPARPQCEYRDLAVSLQQLIRDREADTGSPASSLASPNVRCYRPSDVLIDTDSGKKAYCATHVQTSALTLAEPV